MFENLFFDIMLIHALDPKECDVAIDMSSVLVAANVIH